MLNRYKLEFHGDGEVDDKLTIYVNEHTSTSDDGMLHLIGRLAKDDAGWWCFHTTGGLAAPISTERSVAIESTRFLIEHAMNAVAKAKAK